MTIQKTRAQRQQSKTAYCWLCSIGSEGDKYTREREEEKQSYVQLAKLTRIFAMDSIDIKSLKITILLKYWRMKWTSRAFHDCNCFETKAQAIWSNNLLFTVKSWQMCCCLIFVFIYLTRKEKRYNWTWQEWNKKLWGFERIPWNSRTHALSIEPMRTFFLSHMQYRNKNPGLTFWKDQILEEITRI